ncbi:hypothetical protein [Iodidimonas sp. SYSU 1G8]|uniref:hypothetical protein n=1 Tax=Iodidimonas sp. SYSU 1G8 TaxID=3133967 RepID=UPI0031FEADAE
MIRTLLFAAATAGCLGLAGAASAQGDCLAYGPSPVALTGMVSSLQASGPPGYGKTPETDAVVQVPILQMTPPACVAADTADPARVALQDVNTIQLVFQPQGPRFRAEMTGTSFMVAGTLVPPAGPQHITPVVLVVDRMEQVLAPAAD